MSSPEMTSRQRVLAAYRGEPVDRLPFWAKVANNCWKPTQPEPIASMTEVELLDYIEADGLLHPGMGMLAENPHVETEVRKEGSVRTTVHHTPDGDVIARDTFDEDSQSWHPTKFPIETDEDLARFRWLYTDVVYREDESVRELLEERFAAVGERGATITSNGPSPMMYLVEHAIGPVNFHLMMADYPAELDELLGIMQADKCRRLEKVLSLTRTDVVASIENTSTTLISPSQFEKYCYPHLCEYGRMVEAAGLLFELHMCGHTKALLEKIDTIPAASIEAFTAPTLGNTRLVDGRTLAPSKTLIGGTSANTWLLPIDEIKAYIQAELDACPNHRRIILTTAGVAPPACPAETFREISRWLRTVPVRM